MSPEPAVSKPRQSQLGARVILTSMFMRPGKKLQSLKNLSAWRYIVESGTQWMSITTHIVLSNPFTQGIIKQISVWNTESLGKFCCVYVSFETWQTTIRRNLRICHQTKCHILVFPSVLGALFLVFLCFIYCGVLLTF